MKKHNRMSDSHRQDFDQNVRFYTEAGLWYFNTREGTQVGPFRYRVEAEAMLDRFLDKISAERPRRRAIADNGAYRSAASGVLS